MFQWYKNITSLIKKKSGLCNLHLTVLLLFSDELTFIRLKYDTHFGFILSCASKPEKIQWSWDENYSQKTTEENVLEKHNNPRGRKSGYSLFIMLILSNEHYKELYLKNKLSGDK